MFKNYALLTDVNSICCDEFTNQMSDLDAAKFVINEAIKDPDEMTCVGCWNLNDFQDLLNNLEVFDMFVRFIIIDDAVIDALYKDAHRQNNIECIYKNEFGEQTIVEDCPNCDHVTEIKWDVSKDGWRFKCPKCGEEDHCCSLCMGASDNENNHCDWNADTKLCWRDRQFDRLKKN